MIGADVTFDGPQPGHEGVEIPRLRGALEVLTHLVPSRTRKLSPAAPMKVVIRHV
jgi:hypothetical protein